MFNIALCQGICGTEWTSRTADALQSEINWFQQPFKWEDVDINRYDWLDKLKNFDAILWPPGCMGIKPASHLKEKVYFLEHHIGKLVIPNFETIWHFESKAAQSYVFNYYGIPTPRTVVTFSLKDAMQLLDAEHYPLVFKTSSDAGSRGVWMVKTKRKAKCLAWRTLYTGFWWKLARRLLKLDHRDNVTYWQEFVPNNNCDLRITAIGDKFAVGFWRKNRPHDFRASGSGRIDYDKPLTEDIIHFCLNTNKKLNFDSMAYDIIFRNGRFVVTEICYTYADIVIHNAAGYYERLDNGSLIFRAKHTWPEQLWVRWLAHRLKNTFKKEI